MMGEGEARALVRLRSSDKGPFAVSIDKRTEDALSRLGYRLVDDAWEQDGRRTYIHDDDATPTHFANIVTALGQAGWSRNRNALRTFRHSNANQLIEVEPGGSGVSGHFLHILMEE
jgi:hypothetical protein